MSRTQIGEGALESLGGREAGGAGGGQRQRGAARAGRLGGLCVPRDPEAERARGPQGTDTLAF